jgi:choline dehydrogenase-like flavoprotein
MLDEDEFLSPHGVRALSRYHQDHPYVLRVHGHDQQVDYQPAESTTGLFGGNSNWRGPVWFEPNPTAFQKTWGLNDFYFGTPEWEFPLGHISMIEKTDANILRAGAPRITPGWTLERMAAHTLSFWLTTEDLPDPDNRVKLAWDGRIVLQYASNNDEAHERLMAKLKDMMKEIRALEDDSLIRLQAYIAGRIPLAGVAHQNGTVRFGTDPKTSAPDVNCNAHELDNLYVVDGSFFPSSGAVNPALTIMANALRVGDHLKERLR